MKFGKYIEINADPEWKEFYIDYGKLKKSIKLNDIEGFVAILDEQLAIVNKFFETTSETYSIKVAELKAAVKSAKKTGGKTKRKEFVNVYKDLERLKEFIHLNFKVSR